jgi:hypothetical protein
MAWNDMLKTLENIGRTGAAFLGIGDGANTTPTSSNYQSPPDIFGNDSRISGMPNTSFQAPVQSNTTPAPATTPAQSPGSVYASAPDPMWGYISTMPKIDFGAWRTNAQNQALADVTPMFQTRLANYLSKHDIATQGAQNTYNQDVGDLNAQLGQYMEGSALKGARTGEDYNKSIYDIANEYGAQQNEEAFTYDATRRGAQQQVEESGLGGSGLGAQQLINLDKQRGFSEDKIARDVEGQRYATELFKNRTFEDIAMGVKNKQADTVRGTEYAQQDLDNAIAGIDLTLEIDNLSAEVQKEIDAMNATNNYMSQYYTDYFGGLGTGHQAAATTIYGANPFG